MGMTPEEKPEYVRTWRTVRGWLPERISANEVRVTPRELREWQEAKPEDWAAMSRALDAAEARIAELEVESKRIGEQIEALGTFAYFDPDIRWSQEGGSSEETPGAAVMLALDESREELARAQERNERLMEALRLAVVHVEGPGALARIDAILSEVEGEA